MDYTIVLGIGKGALIGQILCSPLLLINPVPWSIVTFISGLIFITGLIMKKNQT